MIHSDALQSAFKASVASLLTVLRDGGDPSFLDEAKARVNLTQKVGTDYSRAPMSDKADSLTSHNANPMWASKCNASKKVVRTTLGEDAALNFHPYLGGHKTGDLSAGSTVITNTQRFMS